MVRACSIHGKELHTKFFVEKYLDTPFGGTRR
jgi:hypothetical protein